MAAKIKTALITSAAIVAVTASAVTAFHLSRHGTPPAASPIEVPVSADANSQPDAHTAPPADWKGWGIGAYPATSPFQAVRWNNDTPEVQINNTWYQLLSLNDLSINQIITAAKSADREYQRRFEEDLPALLAYMSHEPGPTVTMQVKNLQTQKTETLTDIPLTKENRQSIYAARHPQPTPTTTP